MHFTNHLIWPPNKERTIARKMRRTKRSWIQAIAELQKETKAQKLTIVWISADVSFEPATGSMLRHLSTNTGVSALIVKGEKETLFACDRYMKHSDNLHAICEYLRAYRTMLDQGVQIMQHKNTTHG